MTTRSSSSTPTAIPPAPRSEDPAVMGFARQPMVGWFDPTQLARTGLQAVLSAIFGSFADKREMQAALLATAQPSDYADRGDIWIDYVADTGDGWNSTYTVARLLGAPELIVADQGTSLRLARGRVLVLGGDQVYPTAKRDEYHNRFVGPFTAALPGVADGPPPDMFALPGNHDWYDGLTSFLRLYCQNRRIGGWQTRQSRSYFAILLPHRWWLWGIDTQFESDIDRPQLEYFEMVTRVQVRRGDRIILCTGAPTWVEAACGRPQGYRNLRFFVDRVIRNAGADLALLLTGDLHAYCRYEPEGTGRPAMIIAGGGGAYLCGTHRLPERLPLDEGATDDGSGGAGAAERAGARATYRRAAVYPSVDESRRLSRGVLAFPLLARKFSLYLAGWYLLFAWLTQSASTWLAGATHPASLLETLAALPPRAVATAFATYAYVFAHAPSVVLLCVILVVSLGLFAGFDRRWHFAVGVAHGVVHVVLSAALVWLLARINTRLLGFESFESVGQVIVFSTEMFLIGGMFGGFVMGAYLYLSERLLGLHTNEVFSAQRIEDYKDFLRLHIDARGILRVYPLGVRRVGRRWRLNPAARNGEPWFDPIGEEPAAHLIERPIVIGGPSP